MRPRQRVSSGGRWEPVVGYSRAVRVGDVAWVSGCTAAGPDGAVVGRGDAYAQTVQAIHTIAEALGRLGLSLDHVVKTGVYLADMGEWEGSPARTVRRSGRSARRAPGSSAAP
jgi:enamine deaminase RidA (YjgF/YER057c/UK114 family)